MPETSDFGASLPGGPDWSSILADSPVGIAILSPDGSPLYANAALCGFLGYTWEELRKLNYRDVAHPEDRAAEERIAEFFAGRRPDRERERRYVRKDGTIVWGSVRTSRVAGGNGAQLVLGMITDVTERKRAEEARSRLAAIVESSGDAIIGKSLDGTINFWNRGAESMYGYTSAEILGRPVAILAPQDRKHEVQALVERISREGSLEEFETVRLRKDGTLIDVSLRLSPIRDASGLIVGVSTIARDVTERKQREQEHQSHLQFLENLDRLNRAVQGTTDVEQMLRDLLDVLLLIFDCDRAWLVYPCDPAATSWWVPMERTRPEYPGAFAMGIEIPMNASVQQVLRTVLDSSGSVTFGPGTAHPMPEGPAERFGQKSQIAMAIYPKGEKPYVFGLHQCSYARVWTAQETRLFQEAGARLTDALTSLLALRVLRESEQRQRLALEVGQIGAFETDLAGGRGTWTPELAEVWGFPSDFAGDLNAYCWAHVHPEDLERVQQEFSQLIQTPKSGEMEFRIIRSDGDTRWIRWRGQVIADASRGISRVIGVNMDITERRLVEESQRKASTYARSLIEASPDPLVTISPEGRITDVNAATESVTGRRRAELIGSDFSDYFTEPEKAREGYRKVLAHSEVRDYPLTIRHVSGRVTDVLYNASVYRDEAGKVQGVFAAARDVTERKRAETIRAMAYWISEAAQRAGGLDEFFKLVHQVVSALVPARNYYVALVDSETGMLSFPYFVDEVDPPPSPKLPGRGLTEYVIRTGEPLLASPGVFDDLVARGEVELLGSPSVDWLGVPLKTPGGTIGALVVQSYTAGVRFSDSEKDLLTFISGQLAMAIQRKQAEEALRKSEAEMKEAQRVAHVGSWSWVIDTDTVVWSEEFFRIAGRDPKNTPPNYFKEHATLYTPESLARLAPLVEKAIRTGEPYEVDLELIRPDGTTRWITASGEARRDAKGQIVGLRGTVEDITQQRLLREQFLQAQKMEAVGRLAGGVAHDFNNLLTVIQGYGELLRASLATDDPNGSGVEEILKAAERAGALTRQLLAFSRRQVLEPRVVRLDAVVANMEKMLRRLIGEDVELVIDTKTGIESVKADPGQIEQVLLNLSLNARDAMPDGGRLTIEIANAALDETFANQPGHPEPGSYVMLAVTDTGVGMSAETMSHLFEPFFTTKGPGKGTGLGLATVYGIVKQSGGYIWASSRPGSGATFRIYLPRIEGEAAASESARATDAPGGDETILVVEDEAALRKMAVSVLASCGYTVLEAGSPAIALDVAERHAGRIDLLLTDVIMPGMNGREMAERIVSGRSGLKVLFMSGHVDDVIARHGVLEPGTHLLKKPFTPVSLAREVRKVLEGTTTGGKP
ncbi:MAG: PAS domain S-box protein [Thermoanaerobaculia bacterium]